MNGNELKYTSLTNDVILQQVYDRFLKLPDGETNHKFDNFRESAIAQTLIEIFSGTVDINNYYIQRRAEECYFDTAQLKSSVISLSRMFGYVMNRKEPSHAYLKMIITGNIKDNQVQIPYYSKFSYGGDEYVLVNTMTYRIPPDKYNSMSDDSVITIDNDSFNKPIEVVQGSIREKVFNGATNSQVNAPFQIYKIEDKSFSNVYGDKDFFYNDVTQIYVGEEKNSDTRFSIDRRSLLNWENIDTSDLSQSQSVCVVRTTTDGNIDILFGDGNPNVENTLTDTQATGGFARKGAITRKDNIYVQYLSCTGLSTNKTGIIGDKVEFGGKIYNSNGDDITSKISFELISNVFGGADDESLESIKYSAPKIYYSLDRLVSKDDYVAFLKSLNTPINVKNAVAWGEQEERDLAGAFALIKMFNVALFTVAASLYDVSGDIYFPKEGNLYDDVVLDINYDPYAFQTQGYFNIYVIQEMVNQLKRYSTLTSYKEIDGNNFGVSLIEGSNEALNAIAEEMKSKILTYFSSGSAPLSFIYTSDDTDKTSNIDSSGEVIVSGLNDGSLTVLSGYAYLEGVAIRVNNALIGFKDSRGNRTDNTNFDRIAFIGRWAVDASDNALVKWDSFSSDNGNGVIYAYRVRFNESIVNNNEDPSPCYITTFSGGDNTLMNILGLDDAPSFYVSENVQTNEMNGKITSVVNELSKRSQTNVKNIYMSPIIHRFNLVGDVFVKSLYDKEAVRVEVNNMIYDWLDINADFNQPLYLSNIIEIVESHMGVVHANIVLDPEDIVKYENGGVNYYDPDPTTNTIYLKYTIDEAVAISNKVNMAISAYTATGVLDERSFYTTFSGILYKSFKYPTDDDIALGYSGIFNQFIGFVPKDASYRSDVVHESVLKSDFAVTLEQIHKDDSYGIMTNLLDGSGNINEEFDSNNGYVRGGFSLGSEIVQVLGDAKYSNTKGDSVPFLNYKYK